MGSNVGGSNFSTPIAGLFEEGKKGDTITQKSANSSTSGVKLAEASAIEKAAGNQVGTSFNSLMDLLNRGPGGEAVDASNADQKNYVDMMRQVSSTGGMPNAEDTRQANAYADQMFAPQQEAMKQQYQTSMQDAAKIAAKLNRPLSDPIVQAKLQQEQMRQSAMMSADRSAFVAQESRNSPFQRLQLQGQLADASGSLASQAMSNRMQLLNLGNALQSSERNWRLNTGDRWGISNGTQEQHSGGGTMGGIGAVTGAFGGIMNMGSGVISSVMGGGSGQSQPQPAQANFGGGGSAPIANFGGYNSSGGQMNNIQAAYMGGGGGGMSGARASRLAGAAGGGASGSWGGAGASGGFMGKMGGASSLMALFSDRRVKTNIKAISKEEIAELKSTIKPYTWEYKDQANGQGEWTGVMAQDLQKSKLGRSVLIEEEGSGLLKIDMRKLTSLLLATLASEEK